MPGGGGLKTLSIVAGGLEGHHDVCGVHWYVHPEHRQRWSSGAARAGVVLSAEELEGKKLKGGSFFYLRLGLLRTLTVGLCYLRWSFFKNAHG